MQLTDQSNRFDPENVSLENDDWIADCQSLPPDRAIKLPTIRTSWDALVVLYVLSHLEANFYWLTDDFHRRIAQKAYSSNYEGEWETVQEILEQYPKTPKQFYELFLKRHSPEEFFGNLKRRARRVVRCMNFISRDPHGPVVRAQRHRGYRDKGTLRPQHRPAVAPPEKIDIRIDRRPRIGHPLLRGPD
jgi:hypothetical protein